MTPSHSERRTGKRRPSKLAALALSILLSLLKIGIASAIDCISDDSWIQYDPQEQMCCEGVVHTIRLDIQPYSCCGQDLYNSATHTCCDKQILDRTSSQQCCVSASNEQVYDSDAQLCCWGTVHDKTDGSACCGTTVVDTTHQSCCFDGTGYSPREGLGQCCGLDKLYNASSEVCCEKMVRGNRLSEVHFVGEDAIIDGEFRCCGLEAINTIEQQCCKGVSNEKSSYNQCCGQTTFDLRSQVCCMETVSDLVDGKTECCDTQPYNSANEVCCGFGTRRVYPTGHGNCCRATPYSPVLESCCSGRKQSAVPEIDRVQACCGNQSYLKTHHFCCGGQIFERQPNMECCGGNPYDTSTELCCNNERLQRSSPSLQCCGNTGYDPATETCCAKVGVSFPGVNLTCCYAKTGRASQAYNPESETCCVSRRNVGVYPMPHANEQCCGQSLLQDNQLCDIARQQPINKSQPDHDAVCRPRDVRTGRALRGGIPVTYNTEDKFCTTAGDLMIRLSGEEVCGRRPYQTDSELCCAGQVYRNHDQYENPRNCCGSSVHVYAPSLQCCFANRVFNVPQDNAGFCRNVAYNTNSSSCDRNGIIRPRSQVEDLPELCGTGSDPSMWTPYNPLDNECCGDVLIGPGQTCCNSLVYDTPGTALGSGKCCRHSGGYNPDTQICCNGRLFPTDGNDMECCGARPYEPTDASQICCNKRLHATDSGRTLCTDGTVHSPQETVCEGVRYDVANGECCGRNIMDDTKICCQGFIYSKEEYGTQCCGKVAYNPSAEQQPLCCEDTLHPAAPGLQCCGNQAIDPAERQCCGPEGQRFALLRSSGQTCCGAAAGDYDASQHTCCQGSLHEFLVNGECCGNDVVRDPSKEICCGGLVQVKGYKEHTLCCGGHILDGRRFTCCGSVVLSHWTSQPRECCNGVVFNRNRQECVGGEVRAKEAQAGDQEDTTDVSRRVFARQTEHAQRLTREATDTMEHDVEQTTVIGGQTAHVEERMMPQDATDAATAGCSSLDYDMEIQGCCHGSLYSLANETCMNGIVFGLCDGVIAYNPLTHGCCGDKVFNRSTEYCDETTTLVSQDLDSEAPGTSNMTLSRTQASKGQNASEATLCGGVEYNQLLEGCCNDRLYNLSAEYCHNGSTLIPKSQDRPDRRHSTTTMTASIVTSMVPEDRTVFSVTQEPCSVIRARENVTEEVECCGRLLYDPQNATCCQGITEEEETVVVWSAVTDGVVDGQCCGETAYDSSTAVCCNKEVIDRVWMTPDMFRSCCPAGETWNRLIDACETSPTYRPFMEESSGMSPDD